MQSEADETEAQLAQFTENTEAVEGVQQASSSTQGLEIVKQLPEQIRLGTPITYTINVKAGEDLKGVIVHEELPEGFKFDKSEPEAQISEDGRRLTFRMSELKSDSQQQIKVTGTPQSIGTLQACTTYEIDRGVCTSFEVLNPQLRLSKKGPEQAGICEPVAYTYVIKNEGDTPAENVIIYDTLPEGLRVMEADRQVKIDVGKLDPGQEVSRQVQVMAERAMDAEGSYAYAESNMDEVRSDVVKTQFIAPTLQVQANAARPFEYIGKDAQFTVTVKNTGDTPSEQTVLALKLAGEGEIASIDGGQQGEAQLASATESPVADGNRMQIGALEPGDSESFTVTVRSEDAGRINLIAEAAALCARTEEALATANNTAAIEFRALSALQLEVVDKADPIRVGEETVYEVTVLNEGSADEPNLQVSAQLPKGVSLVSVDGTSSGNADGQTLTFEKIDVLPAGDSATWYVRVKAEEAAGMSKFIVNAKSDTVQPVTDAEPTRLY